MDFVISIVLSIQTGVTYLKKISFWLSNSLHGFNTTNVYHVHEKNYFSKVFNLKTPTYLIQWRSIL